MIAEPVDDYDRSLLILYGSQTGTAQDIAESIGRQARRRYFRARVFAMDSYDRSLLLDEHYVICIAATTGQGAEPQNMREFWKTLRRGDLPEDLLGDIEFTTFGLGDSSYPKFNWVGKKLHRRFEQLGGSEFYPRGEGDDQNYSGVETTLDPWLVGLWETLLSREPLPPGKEIVPEHIRPPPRINIVPCSFDPQAGPLLPPAGSLITTLKRNERVTALDHFQDTRHLEFEFENDVQFFPGAVAEVMPENSPEDVQTLIELLKWGPQADHWFEMEANLEDQPLPSHWPRRTTIRKLFTTQLDAFSVPRRWFFQCLAYFTTDPNETEKLREFCSPDGQDELAAYAYQPRRTIYEVLTEFRSVALPLEYITDLFPEMRPRQFSIASSPQKYPREVHLLVAVVRYKTRLRIERKGICSSWLRELQAGNKIPMRILASALPFPLPNIPFLCVGPGTGIAPFRSLIQSFPSHSSIDRKNKSIILFGCRSATRDFYYRPDWEDWETAGGGRFLWCASREQEGVEGRKRYVQDVLKEHSHVVWQCIGQHRGWIYISGSAGQMPKSVRKALKEIYLTESDGKIPEREDEREVEANRWMEGLEKEGRMWEETWS